MKLMFLDIDGVLNNRESIGKGVHLLPEKSLLIDEICEKTDAYIIISSSWRYSHSQETLQTMLWISGMDRNKILGSTPRSEDGRRGREIKECLDDFASEHHIESFVIIDDEISDMLPEQKKHIVHTSMKDGITREGVDWAIKILGGK